MRDTSKPSGYETSDLKADYLSRYDLQSRRNTPILSQEQLFNGEYMSSN